MGFYAYDEPDGQTAVLDVTENPRMATRDPFANTEASLSVVVSKSVSVIRGMVPTNAASCTPVSNYC